MQNSSIIHPSPVFFFFFWDFNSESHPRMHLWAWKSLSAPRNFWASQLPKDAWPQPGSYLKTHPISFLGCPEPPCRNPGEIHGNTSTLFATRLGISIDLVGPEDSPDTLEALRGREFLLLAINTIEYSTQLHYLHIGQFSMVTMRSRSDPAGLTSLGTKATSSKLSWQLNVSIDIWRVIPVVSCKQYWEAWLCIWWSDIMSMFSAFHNQSCRDLVCYVTVKWSLLID